MHLLMGPTGPILCAALVLHGTRTLSTCRTSSRFRNLLLPALSAPGRNVQPMVQQAELSLSRATQTQSVIPLLVRVRHLGPDPRA